MILEISSQTRLSRLLAIVSTMAFHQIDNFYWWQSMNYLGTKVEVKILQVSYHGALGKSWLQHNQDQSLRRQKRLKIQLTGPAPETTYPTMYMIWMTMLRANWLTIPSADTSWSNVELRSTPKSARSSDLGPVILTSTDGEFGCTDCKVIVAHIYRFSHNFLNLLIKKYLSKIFAMFTNNAGCWILVGENSNQSIKWRPKSVLGGERS